MPTTRPQPADQPAAAAQRRCELPCVHCGLPTVCDASDDLTKVFCCGGCRQAYELIHGWGLGDFYAIRDQNQASSGLFDSADTSRYDALDDIAFLGLSAPRELADGRMQAELSISGLHCAACAWLIENVATRTAGWTLARVRLNRHTIELVFDPSQIKLSQIARLVARLGYELSPLTSEPVDRFRIENRRLLMQIAIAGFFAANAMWIAVALYAGDASGLASEHRTFLRLAGTALGLASIAIPGRTFFVSAWASIRTRTPHMDLPVALGLSVGTTVGLIHAITGTGDVYFDSLTMLVFLLLVGRWIQFRQQHRAASAVDLLLRITPQHARLVNEADPDGQTRWVLVTSLAAEQLIRVNVGESIPCDGRVVALGKTTGESMLDRSLLTGESEPIPTRDGQSVAAGTVNLSRPITVSVEATGQHSRIGKVMQSVEAAMAQRTPIVQLADRIGGVFVVVVTLLAIAAFVVWFPSGMDVATANATALLIVACPCALALATPLAIAVTLGRAAKRKILIRDGGVLQQLSRTGIVWFDKTGTLTEGRPRAEVVWGDRDSIAEAAAIERECCHAIADAIVRQSEQLGLSVPAADDVRLSVGGVQGCCGGHNIAVGNETLMRSLGVRLADDVMTAIGTCLENQMTPVVIARDRVAVAVVSITDPIKQNAAETIARIRSSGWQVGILSGDHPDVVRKVSDRVGIDSRQVFGGLSPEDKLATVTGNGHGDQTVVMIGDGANDAAALAAADVGIAVRGGAEVSLQAAPVFVASGALVSLADLMDAAKRSSALIRTTFAVSLAYNLFAVVLALAGYISPLLAAVLMPISSVSVLSLTLVWPTFRDPPS
ncbi:heavy metal translocating P-type ATPase metal-binding domain-containing protein [Stieleria sp. TO1_6]|uniref:heavy metal translocating P-type ATPase n=1 Tax=Stieleria tagensis TaxID=2956795 RepID=UPI00209B04D3|nr:heavy metal translocating P-type ATPase metal-binding domain-containing protein [Stieleria tagensis]MCO8122455.1 heavy metal translocating P-type ATPase metal-binding domain-containing protein [Stieleria tagensis]